jgi:hypothetical protein
VHRGRGYDRLHREANFVLSDLQLSEVSKGSARWSTSYPPIQVKHTIARDNMRTLMFYSVLQNQIGNLVLADEPCTMMISGKHGSR